MAPLAHILAPLIAKHAERIEAELGHAPPPAAPVQGGYLSSGITATAQRVRPDRASPATDAMLARKPKGKTASDQALADLRAAPKSLPGMVRNEVSRQQYSRKIRERDLQLLPNAQSPQPAPAPTRKKGKKGEIVIPYADGLRAQNERGEWIDYSGKKPVNLGYLAPQDPNIRFGDRRPNDVSLGDKDVYDQFGAAVLQNRFGEHLKAMQENRDSEGLPTDRFPNGYFQGMDPRRKAEIEAGVARLMELERGVPM